MNTRQKQKTHELEDLRQAVQETLVLLHELENDPERMFADRRVVEISRIMQRVGDEYEIRTWGR